jgi:ABC-2 type transport system ATP-binding protein
LKRNSASGKSRKERFATMSNDPAIRTRGLTRYFGAKPAVYELNLEVPRGSVFAFVGRNGSGKSTTIRMLLGLLPPTRGGATILDYDIRHLTPEARTRIGFLTEEHQLYGWMSVRECSQFQARFFSRWNERTFQGVIDHFGLKSAARVKDLSRGERAGLALGLTVATDPELLVLDDPALGLDPVARRSLMESMIYLTRRSDRTIFFSTHQLADMERVADYVAVLDESVLRACCPLDSFREQVQQVRLSFAAAPPPLPTIPGVLQVFRTERGLRVICVHYNQATERALRALSPVTLELSPVNLEDALISYLGNPGEKAFILAETEMKL